MKKLISVFVLVVIAAGIYYIWHVKHPKSVNPQTAPLVMLSPVITKNIPIVVQTTGNLIANQQTNISPKINGYITNINFQEGEFVKAGTVLITLDNTKEQQAYLSAAAQANLDKSTYQRYLTLRQRGITAPQDLDQFKSKYDQSAAAERSAKEALDEMTLVAPFDGYLGSRSISVGNFVNMGQNLLTITDTKKLRVQYSLPSRYAQLVQVGQLVTITADFLANQKFEAKVTYVAPDVDPNTQTIEVHASFDNDQQILKSGQSVSVNQVLGTRQNALVIPADALIANINGNYIYKVQNDKVISVPVTVGEHYHDNVVIIAGLASSDQIMTKGQFQVKTGQIVRVDHSK